MNKRTTKDNRAETIFKLGIISVASVVYSLQAHAVDVSNWAELNTNKAEQSILFVNDILAEGSPKPITFNSSSEQTIDGNGYSFIGANGYSMVFNSTANVTFKNLGSYAEGTSDDNTFSYTDLNNETKYVKINKSVNSFPAYFITNNKIPTLNIDNSAFMNNGARLIILSGSNKVLNVKDSVFANNTVSSGTPVIDGGGTTNTVNIENSIFYNNVNTRGDGGAISSRGTTTIKNSYFINNIASDDFGGAIQLSSGSKNNTIEGSKFEGNVAGYGDGGAIAMETNVEINYIKDTEFLNNTTTWGDGGAISTCGGGFLEGTDNVVFEGNSAYVRGGGLWGGMRTAAHDTKPSILIKNTTFKNNVAGSGGGMFMEGYHKQNYVYITDSEFINNTATEENREGDLWYGYPRGAGLESARWVGSDAWGVPLVINNVTFSGNNAVKGITEGYSAGGGVYYIGSEETVPAEIVDSTFKNNSAYEGGALFLDNADAAIIAATKDVVFSDNTAEAETDSYNAGSDIYFQADTYSATLSLNADEGKKIVFNGSIAAYSSDDTTATIDINKSGVTYNTYDGTTETKVSAGTGGEIIFNAPVGDAENYFENLNLHNGTMSVSKDAKLNANVNVLGGTMNIADQAVTAKSVNFSNGSTLSLMINSDSEYGNLTAENITVEDGAKLKAVLAQGAVLQGKSITLQLLSADNKDFNNFTDSFENNMYKFEKADKNGAYTITQDKTAEDVVKEEGARPWVAQAVKDYVDVGGFEEGSVAADVASKLTELAQTDAKGLILAVKTLAPMETAVIQGQAVEDVNRLFKTVDGYLRGERSLYGLSSGDVWDNVKLWFRPYIGESKVNDRGKISGLRTHSHGIIAGIEKEINSNFRAGFGFQYDETDIDGIKRTTEADSTIGFVYGEYKVGNWFINSTGSYGESNYHESMYALDSKYKANYNVYIGSASVITGYQINSFTPEIGLRYYNIKRDGYTDSAMQSVRKAETDILRATAGIHFMKPYKNFYPDIYVGLTYDVLAGKNDTTVNLANNTAYTVKGKRLSRLGYELNTGLNIYLRDDLIFGVNYIGAYREKYQEHTGMMRLQYNF